MIRPAGLVLLGVLAAGCRGSSATMEARWTGADSGEMTGRSVATWCAPDRRLEVQGLHGDSGVILVAYPEDTSLAGRYPVFEAGVDSVTRPGAAAAVRWFGLAEIVGYRSTGGWVELSSDRAGRLAGTFEVRLVRQGMSAALTLEGRLDRVPVLPAQLDCVAPVDSAPTGPERDTVLP